MNKSDQNDSCVDESKTEDIFYEMQEVYYALELSSDELYAQSILGLDWATRKAEDRGMLKNAAILANLRENARQCRLSSFDYLLLKENIFLDSLNEVIMHEIQDISAGIKTNDPFAFFFAFALLILPAEKNLYTYQTNISLENTAEVAENSVFSEGNTLDSSVLPSDIKAILPDITSAGNYKSLRLCIFPGCQKPETAIKAHSISKSNFLNPYVSSNNMFWHITTPKAPKVGRLHFDSITPSNASCFTGLCQDHDAMFHPLDNSTLSKCLDSRKLLSFMIFRTALYGYWQRLDADYRIPVLGWNTTVKGNRIKGVKYAGTTNRPPIPHEVSRRQLRDLLDICRKKIEEEKWEDIEHHIFRFKGINPRVISAGVSAIFYKQGIPTPAFIHTFPHANSMIAIISHIKGDSNLLKNRLSWLKNRPESEQKKLLTWATMHHWNNLYFTEQYYEFLTESTKSHIIDMALVYSWLSSEFINNRGETVKMNSSTIFDKIAFSFFG